MTTHWIVEKPGTKMLKMCSMLLAFHHIYGHHTGASLVQSILYLLDWAKVTAKVDQIILILSTQLAHALLTHRQQQDLHARAQTIALLARGGI